MATSLMLRWHTALLALLWHGCVSAVCPSAADWQQITLQEQDYLITLVRLNGQPVAASLDMYQVGEHLLVPVLGLSSQLKAQWQFDPNRQLFSAAMDTKESVQCQLGSASNSDNPWLWGMDGFDTFIDVRFIAALLGGDYGFDYEILQLSLTTRKALPILQGPTQISVPVLEKAQTLTPDLVIADNYRYFTPPLINYRATASQDSIYSGRYNAQLNGFFDLLKHESQWRINQTNNQANAFVRLGKTLQTAVGPIRYEVGDLQFQGNELTTQAQIAGGLRISNQTPGQSGNFATVTLEEIVLPGWQAQLFRNGQFLEEQFSGSDNRVVFENVETFYGLNLFEIKLYGPEGQQEVREQRINLGREQVAPGQLQFDIIAADASLRVIDSDTDAQSFDRRWQAALRYGINQRFTLLASAQHLAGLDQQDSYANLGAIVNWSSAALKTEVSHQQGGGSAVFFGLSTALEDLRINAEARWLDNYSSEIFAPERQIQGDARLRFSGRSQWLGGFGWNANLRHLSVADNGSNNLLNFNINRNLLGGTFSTGVTADNAANDNNFRHRLYWSGNLQGWQLSNALEWAPFDGELLNYNATLRWPQSLSTYNETRLDYRPEQPNRLLLQHQFNWRQPEFNLQFGAQIDAEGEWRLSLGIAGDLEYSTADHRAHFYRPRGANTRSINALAFLDHNRNQRFDADDEPLPDVQIEGSPHWRSFYTNTQGRVQLATSRDQQVLTIDEASLPDPFMRPQIQQVQVNSHRGGSNEVALPVVTFNEIEGAIYQVRDAQSRGYPAMPLRLINDADEIVAQTETEADGYFFFSNVAPGHYRLALDPNILAQQQLIIQNLPSDIAAPDQGDIIILDDILLSAVPKPTAEEAHVSRHSVTQGYTVQLGVFRKARSVAEVLKFLPLSNQPIALFRHHHKGNTTATVGTFNTVIAAQQWLTNLIQQVPVLVGAYVVPQTKFSGDGWSREYALSALDDKILGSHRQIRALPLQTQLCQLAAYQSPHSIAPELLQRDLLLVQKQLKQQRYFSLVAVQQAPQDCQTLAAEHGLGQSFSLGVQDLLPQLHDQLFGQPQNAGLH